MVERGSSYKNETIVQLVLQAQKQNYSGESSVETYQKVDRELERSQIPTQEIRQKFRDPDNVLRVVKSAYETTNMTGKKVYFFIDGTIYFLAKKSSTRNHPKGYELVEVSELSTDPALFDQCQSLQNLANDDHGFFANNVIVFTEGFVPDTRYPILIPASDLPEWLRKNDR